MSAKHIFFQKTAALLLALTCTTGLYAQNKEQFHGCAAEMSAADWAAHRDVVKALRTQPAAERGGAPTTLWVGVAMHIVRSGDGDEGLSTDDAELALERANLKYEPVGIQFFQCEAPEIIESDYWYDLEFQFEWDNDCGAGTPEYDLTDEYQVPNRINIYWVNTNGWSWSAGPSAIANSCMDWVIMHQGHADSYRTLAHELGHYLGLPHTFAGFDENVTRNAANGCYNCEEEGDLFCDTPADHHDNDGWDGCEAVDLYDDCGVLITPDPENIMSYHHCNAQEQHFSNQQEAAIRYNLANGRSYLTCPSGCAPSYVLAGLHQFFITYEAQNLITSTAVLAAGVAVQYAADEIRLLPGFSAPAGTTLHARAQSCLDDAAPPVSETRTMRRPAAAPPEWSARLTPTLVRDVATLTLDLPAETPVSVALLSTDGRMLRQVFAQKNLPPGTHRLELNGTDWPGGVYRVVVQTPSERTVLPLVKL